jgi:chromosome segregation ATPase
MFDALAVADDLTDSGLNPEQVAAITRAVQRAAEQGESDGLAELRSEISGSRVEVARQFAAVGGQVAECRAALSALDARLAAGLTDVRTEIGEVDTRRAAQIVDARTEITALCGRLATQLVNLRTERHAELRALQNDIKGINQQLSTHYEEHGDQIRTVRSGLGSLDERLSMLFENLSTLVRNEIFPVRKELDDSRRETARQKTVLVRWMVGTAITTAALTVTVLQFIG